MAFVDVTKLRELNADAKVIEFAEFINQQAVGKSFPDFQEMDLMEIANLLRYVYVIKLVPDQDKRLLFHFSGTEFDDLYERNVTGLYLEDFYTGDNKETVLKNMNAIIDEKQSYYFVDTARFEQPSYEKRRKINRLGCPCSSNGVDINFSIGLVFFDFYTAGDEDFLVPV